MEKPPLLAVPSLADPTEFQEWWRDLLAEAMQGKLDYQRIQGIPAFAPVQQLQVLGWSFVVSAEFTAESEKGVRNRCFRSWRLVGNGS